MERLKPLRGYHKALSRLLLFLIYYLPISAFVGTWLIYGIGVPGAVKYLKEGVLILILGLNIVGIIFSKKHQTEFWKSFRENKAIYLVMTAYLLWISLSFFWLDSGSLTKFIFGFKYDGFIFLCLLAGLTLPKEITDKVKIWIKEMAKALVIAIGVGLFFYFVIGPENYSWFGFRDDWSTFYVGESLAFCQKIENMDLCRFQGLFSGPNQAGANILLAIVLTIMGYSQGSFKKSFLGTALVLCAVAMILTFSRSSWLALIALIVLFLLTVNKVNLKKYLLLFLAGIVALLGMIYLFVPETINRLGSNSERIGKYVEAFEHWQTNVVVGHGLGFSGPASHAFGMPVITENWFLQVLVNYGLIGIILFVSLYYLLTSRLLRSDDYRLVGLLFIALLIPLNLLHYWEDSSFSYLFFLVVGLAIVNKSSTTEKSLV